MQQELLHMDDNTSFEMKTVLDDLITEIKLLTTPDLRSTPSQIKFIKDKFTFEGCLVTTPERKAMDEAEIEMNLAAKLGHKAARDLDDAGQKMKAACTKYE